MYDRTIVVNGFSKSHAMTGWRMGYVCAPQEPIIQCLTKLHQFGIMSAPTTSQYAAVEAMRNGDPGTSRRCGTSTTAAAGIWWRPAPHRSELLRAQGRLLCLPLISVPPA